jgi:hypothetical protein
MDEISRGVYPALDAGLEMTTIERFGDDVLMNEDLRKALPIKKYPAPPIHPPGLL